MADRKFEFDREEDGSLSPVSAIFQALGAASMAWTETPTGVFDSTHAKEIGDALVAELGVSSWSLRPVHCDASILHAPGECGYCDQYGKGWQEYREMARINFTGHADEGKAPCPSTHFRPTEKSHRWPGNRPQKKVSS